MKGRTSKIIRTRDTVMPERDTFDRSLTPAKRKEVRTVDTATRAKKRKAQRQARRITRRGAA